ncbi:hypothetical protein CapIbe_018011 [Capra ibex]
MAPDLLHHSSPGWIRAASALDVRSLRRKIGMLLNSTETSWPQQRSRTQKKLEIEKMNLKTGLHCLHFWIALRATGDASRSWGIRKSSQNTHRGGEAGRQNAVGHISRRNSPRKQKHPILTSFLKRHV